MGLVDAGKMPKSITKLLNISRKYSLWVYQWGLACCALEMGAAFGSPRYDVMRLGVIPFPASPRQADLVVEHQDAHAHAVVPEGTIHGHHAGGRGSVKLVPLAAVQQAR